MTAADPPGKIFTFQDSRCLPDPVFQLPPESLHPFPAPIVVDNGSFQCRAGWACAGAELGSPRLEFRALAARSRGAARTETQVGNDIPSLEPLRWLLKSQFDRNVVVNFEIQELMLDYIFLHLGIGSEGRVDHPLVLTEAPCNPLHCRQMMSELLFECYGVPSVAYGVDALFSFYNHGVRQGAPRTGLVVTSGYHCSHVLPFIDGRLDAVNCKRLNVGGSQAAAYMQRLLQLKYPAHQAAITPTRMEELLHHHCYVAEDYQLELEKWRSAEFYEAEVHRMQLPFSEKGAGVYGGVDERLERRAQQQRRCREERLQQDQERLHTLISVQELLEEGAVEQFHRRLMELNMDSAEELLSYIHKLTVSVEHQRMSRAEMTEVEQQVDDGDVDPDLDEESARPEKPLNTQPVFNLAEYHQLFVGTERLRAPEVLFRPYLMGEEQMGLTEMIHFVLEQYPPEQQAALCENVFLTGGNLLHRGVKERVERELRAVRPFQSHFKVSLASRPSLDAWFGAREWAVRNTPGSQGWISRLDYEEKGGEYLSEHGASNVFIPLRVSKPAARVGEGSSGAEVTASVGTVTGSDSQTAQDSNSGRSESVGSQQNT